MYTPTVMQVLRKQKHWTQADLAKRIGKTQSEISNYENGWRRPSKVTIRKLAKELGCEPKVLLDPWTE